MRHGHINKSENFADLLRDPLIAKAFAWLQRSILPPAREEPYSIVGEDASAKVITYTPEHPDSGKFETHYDHVDLQVCIGPSPERILVERAEDLSVTEDHPERDVTFYATPPGGKISITLQPYEFVIFNTETDAHMPQRIVNYKAAPGEHSTRKNLKVVIKLRKSALIPGLKL